MKNESKDSVATEFPNAHMGIETMAIDSQQNRAASSDSLRESAEDQRADNRAVSCIPSTFSITRGPFDVHIQSFGTLQISRIHFPRAQFCHFQGLKYECVPGEYAVKSEEWVFSIGR